MLPYGKDIMPLLWTFQQDKDSKHTASKAYIWLQHNDTLRPFSIGPCELCLKNVLNFVFIVYFNKL